MAPQARGFAPGNMQISGDEIQETLRQKRDGLNAMQAQAAAMPLGTERNNLNNLADLAKRNLRDASAASMTARTGGSLGSLNSDMNGVLAFDYARHNQEAKGFKGGGVIRGPGTGTSDSIPDRMHPGTFIMPADSTKAIGPEVLKNIAKVPVRVSNGEFEFTPEQVQSVGSAVLSALKDATHEPVEQHAEGGIVGRMQTRGPGKKEYNDKFGFGPGTGRAMAPYDFTTGYGNRGYRDNLAHGGSVKPQRLFGGGSVAFGGGSVAFGGLADNVQRAGYDDAEEAEGIRQRGMRFNASFEREQRRLNRWEEAHSPEGQLKAAQAMDELTRFTSPKSRLLRDWDTEQRYRGMQQQDFQQTGYIFADGGTVRGFRPQNDANGGAVPFGARGLNELRSLIPQMESMGYKQAQPQVQQPQDNRGAAGLKAIIPQMEAMGYKQQPQQYFADGGFVQGIKRAFGMDEERNAQIAAYRARAAAEKAQAAQQQQAQQPQQPQQRAISDYSGMSATQRREKELGLADGGRVRPRGFVAGKGTATSDSIPARLSNGEYVLPADTVRAVGVEALDALRESTHKPVKGEQANAARGFFAGGTPGGVQAAYDDWQSKKQPWYMPTPRGNMEERIAEANYIQALQNQFAPKPTAPSLADQPNPTDQRLAQGKQQSPAMPPPAKTAAPQANAQAESANVGVGNMGREGMTNAQVGAANPQGRIKVERKANGTLSLSGTDVRGDPSYTDASGNPLAGGGLRGKGFGRFVVAPAGAHVAMGPNGSYAFANEAPAKRAVPQSSDPSQARGFAPGMSAEQMAQYAREVEAARANMVGNQIVANARGNQAVRDWNDLRSPVGIARRNLEFDMKNGPIDRSLSGSRGGAGDGRTSVAQQAAADVYRDLAGSQFRTAGGEAQTAAEQQRWQYEAERKAAADAAAQEMANRKYGLQAGEFDMRREAAGFQTRAEKRRESAYDNYSKAKTDEDRQAIAKQFPDLFGQAKDAAHRMEVVRGKTDPMTGQSSGDYVVVQDPKTGEVRQIQMGAASAAPTQALPPKDQLKAGQTYSTPRGPARWDGNQFIPV